MLIIAICFALPALAQLGYQAPPSAPAAIEKPADPAERIKKTRSNKVASRPDWYGLFMVWAKQNPSIVLSGLRDQNSFDNFASFMACDWVRDYRSNDITWPKKQIEIVQKFNERALNPPVRFRLLTYAVLGTYVHEQQQFVFHPLENTAFSIKYPAGKAFGIEDDCEIQTTQQQPWPNEFIIGFKNADFITALPMDKLKAEHFLNNLPKNDKGAPDRRLVVEVEFDVLGFEQEKIEAQNNNMPPVKTWLTARRAIVYADSNKMRELGRFGFEPISGSPALPVPQQQVPQRR